MTQAHGHNGQVQFDGQYVTIARKGFLARATVGKGEKRIPLTAITSVQWKPAGALVNGFIQFETAGPVRSSVSRLRTPATTRTRWCLPRHRCRCSNNSVRQSRPRWAFNTPRANRRGRCWLPTSWPSSAISCAKGC